MHVSQKWYLNGLFSKIDSAPLVGNLIHTYHTNFSADRDNSLAGSASQKIWYSGVYLQLRKWCNLSNGLDGFKAALIACKSHTDNGMHSDHWFPAPLLKLFSSTLINFNQMTILLTIRGVLVALIVAFFSFIKKCISILVDGRMSHSEQKRRVQPSICHQTREKISGIWSRKILKKSWDSCKAKCQIWCEVEG